jgi:hypothetical protein
MEIIILSVSLVLISVGAIVSLVVVIYNQMLMVNEINKRLLLIAKESQEKERLTMAELESWIRSSGNVDAELPVKEESKEEESFDPFNAQVPSQDKDTDL